jgi:hypothetical protein
LRFFYGPIPDILAAMHHRRCSGGRRNGANLEWPAAVFVDESTGMRLDSEAAGRDGQAHVGAAQADGDSSTLR